MLNGFDTVSHPEDGQHSAKFGTKQTTRQRRCLKLRKCNECGKAFNFLCELEKHLRIHTGEKPYSCGLCGKSFTQDSALAGHVRMHSGEKPFPCQICGKRFTYSSQCRAHERIHAEVKAYPCPHCDKGFAALNSLKRHLTTHSGEKLFKCQNCLKRFAEQCKLTRHASKCAGVKLFKCRHCDEEFVKPSFRRHHEKMRHLPTVDAVPDVGNEYHVTHPSWDTFSESLFATFGVDDEVIHDKASETASDTRRQQCTRISLLDVHNYCRPLDGTTVTRCENTCEPTAKEGQQAAAAVNSREVYDASASLTTETYVDQNELLTIHDDVALHDDLFHDHNVMLNVEVQSNISAGACLLPFNNCINDSEVHLADGEVLTELLEQASGDMIVPVVQQAVFEMTNGTTPAKKKRSQNSVRTVKCEECGKMFPFPSQLKVHMRTHTGDKPFCCLHCSKQFTQHCALLVHLRVHTNVRAFSCRYCDKTFVYRQHCQTHERGHTGEKPFHCHYCRVRFSTSQSRKRHERTHTGEKPFVCGSCERRFVDHSNLVKHERIHHKDAGVVLHSGSISIGS